MQDWMIIALVSIVVVAAVGWFIYARLRSKKLQERFGSAYDQTVSELGSRRRAEAQLEWRERHARQLRDRPLNPSDRQRFMSRWKRCQALFVDDPAGAVAEADDLLVEVMRTRGYAADNTVERTTDIVAAYPQHAERYRLACENLDRHRRSPLSTDSLRTTFLYCRDLFTDLVGGYDEKLKRAS